MTKRNLSSKDEPRRVSGKTRPGFPLPKSAMIAHGNSSKPHQSSLDAVSTTHPRAAPGAFPRQASGLAAITLAAFSLLFLILTLNPPTARASERPTIKLACSAQVYNAMGHDFFTAFSKETGIEVKVEEFISPIAVTRLANDLCDAACSAQALDHRYRAMGFVESPFAKDALVVITHIQNKLKNFSIEQLRSIFCGSVTEWEQLGGSLRRIMVIIPNRESAAYRNFTDMIMQGKDSTFDLMTASSPMAGEVVRRFPGSISFISRAETRGRPDATRIIRIDGKGPEDQGYRYYQTFSLITKGEPKGDLKRFLDFARSEKGAKILKDLGMITY